MTTEKHIYTESGITVDLTGYSHFRFGNCRGYEKIKGDNIKEIDFGWWNGYKKLFENIVTFRIISNRQAERIFKDRTTELSFVKKLAG